MAISRSGPRPAKQVAAGPMTSLHTRTHRPHMMHFLGSASRSRGSFSAPYSAARVWISSLSGERRSMSWQVILREARTASLRAATSSPSWAG